MANLNVFRGSDATLTLAVDDSGSNTLEAQAAKAAVKDIITFGEAVGRVTSVEVYVQTALEHFHEIGRQHPAALRPGNINISGKIGRAYINGALLKLLLGDGVEKGTTGPFSQPSFDLSLQLNDSASSANSTLTIHGVKFENWVYNLPEDDFVMESVTFKGLSITVEDKEAA